MTAPKKRGPRKGTMTEEHKAALADGRREGHAIRAYLAAIAAQDGAQKRGRKPATAEALQEQLDEATDPVERVLLRARVRQAVARESNRPDYTTVEADFIKYVLPFSERLGITWGDWRAEGVSVDVLLQAGFKRSRS